mgnify:CR=1 FL=1
MIVHRDIQALPSVRHAVLTIGTFDGVHRGHAIILDRVNELAQARGGESVLVTFHPHPRFVLNPGDSSLQLLNTIDEKLEQLEKSGLDHVVVTPFDKRFSQQPAIQYVKDFLVGHFHPDVIVIGYDHRFGKDRSGGIDLLREYSEVFGYEVEEISRQMVDDIAVSSTKIRTALHEGRVQEANHLLGHRFTVRGMVTKGEGIGRRIGFPTANLHVSPGYKLVPGTGVYAVTATVDGASHGGMLNIGYRPTFEGTDKTVEVHIFDFDRAIYGETIELGFVARIRDERPFDGPDALVEQLKEDERTARAVLARSF